MDVTRFAIEKNRITVVALLAVVLAGIGAFRTLPRAEDPGFIIRTALVMTFFPGAGPERVEMLVTDKLEKAIQEMPELDFVTSISRTGVSQVMVNVKPSYTDMRPIWDDLRRKVDDARGDLPEGVIGPVVNDDFGDVFGVVIGLTGEGFSYAELKETADQVRDQLLRIDDVARVDIYGAQEERIFVEYNDSRLAELGMSAFQLKSLLEARNIIIPGGNVATGTQRIALEPSGNFESVEDLRRSVIQVPGQSRLLYLEDVATVTRGYIDPPSSKMSATGAPALGLAVSMQEGGNIITLGERVSALLDQLRAVYPIGVEFDVIVFQPTKVDQKVRDFVGNLMQAIGIVILVMLITLGLRTGLVVAALIPGAMVSSFLMMSLFHIGIDQISLAALIIALGMLVDNAIVMSESILVSIGEGKEKVAAAVDSARELRIPLLTSSLTTSAAFLPIYLAESEVGEYTASLFKVVTIALLCSWVLALTLTPLLCVLFVKVKRSSAADRGRESRWQRGYRGFLLGLLRRPLVSLAGILAVFAVSMLGFRLVPNIFFPPNDAPTFTIELKLPEGTRIERTEAVVLELEEFLRRELLAVGDGEGIRNWGAFIGQGAPRFYLSYNPEQTRSSYAFLIVNTTSRKQVDVAIPALEAYCRDHFPDLTATIQPLLLGPPVEAPVQVRISGAEADPLFDIVERVKSRLEAMPGTKSVSDNWGLRAPKLRVEINAARARRAGVSNQDVAISLQTALTGFETTEYREGDQVIPVTLRSVAADRDDVGKLEGLNIFSQTTGQSVPLKQVADVIIDWEPALILRRDRYKTVTVNAHLEPGLTAAETVAGLDEWLAAESSSWGIGYDYEYGGEIESTVESSAAIGAKLPIAALIIVLLLVGQFNSIRRPLIILMTIPLGMIGVVVGLLMTGSYFGFMTLLGVISLAGIVINNAIVLLERIKIEIEENGLDPPRAVVEAAMRRTRPILLTTTTTIGGLIPLWLGGGPMWEPMAIAIIFGLLFATTLTLGVVPVLYAVLFRVNYKGFRWESGS